METNCHQSDQLLPPSFLNLSSDQPVERSSQFSSPVSSVFSSPSSHTPVSATYSATAVTGEPVRRLGSTGEISPRPHQFFGGGNNGSNTSCYSAHVNTPPKLDLSIQGIPPISGSVVPTLPIQLPPLVADPRFQEGAAIFSCFGARNCVRVAVGAGGSQMCDPYIPMQNRSQTRPEVASVSAQSVAMEESLVSDHTIVGGGCNNTRKCKAAQRGRARDAPLTPISKDLPKVEEKENLSAKRTKFSQATEAGKDDVKLKEEPSCGTNSSGGEQKPKEEDNPKSPEPAKQDYIHVRARRGQATDSHSLAERVRREKISERMKFLQGLVPGCNKVTGKAVMLDEIINYVQSLQRQVEFLSMKLAAVNPWMDFNMENLLHKNMHHSPKSSLSSGFSSEITTAAFPFAPQPLHNTSHQNIVTGGLENSLESKVRKSTGMQSSPLDGFDDFPSQGGVFWDDDLQNVVQMGFCQNQESVSSSAFHVQFGG